MEKIKQFIKFWHFMHKFIILPSLGHKKYWLLFANITTNKHAQWSNGLQYLYKNLNQYTFDAMLIMQ